MSDRLAEIEAEFHRTDDGIRHCLGHGHNQWLIAEVKRLRLIEDASRLYFDKLHEQNVAAFGDDAEELIEALEQSTTGTIELAALKNALRVLLVKPIEMAEVRA